MNFGSAYGCEAPKFQELLVTDLVTATKMLDAKLAKFSGYESWKEKVERDTLKTGYAATKLGGRRHLQEAILSDDKWRQQSAARQASNFEIQSAGAEVAKKAMPRIWDSGIFFKLDQSHSKGQTSLPGVFAAGDCTTVPYKQIIIAMGAGATASLSAFDHLIRSSAPA